MIEVQTVNLILNVPKGKPTTALDAESRDKREVERTVKIDQIQKIDLENSQQQTQPKELPFQHRDPVMIKTDGDHRPTMVPQEIG